MFLEFRRRLNPQFLFDSVQILLVCKNKTQQQPWSKNPLFRWAKNEQRFETQNTVTRWSWALSRWTRINLLHYTPTCLGKLFSTIFFSNQFFQFDRYLFTFQIPSRILCWFCLEAIDIKEKLVLWINVGAALNAAWQNYQSNCLCNTCVQ